MHSSLVTRSSGECLAGVTGNIRCVTKVRNSSAASRTLRRQRLAVHLDNNASHDVLSRPRATTNGADAFRSQDDEASLLIKNIRALPWQRAAVWLVCGFVAWQLADFFGIFMGAFILTFVGRSFTFSLQNTPAFTRLVKDEDAQRKALVITYFVVIASIIGVFGVLTIPYIAHEAADFIARLQAENIWTVVVEKMRMGLGDNVMEQLERFLLMASQENVLKLDALDVSAGWTPGRVEILGEAIHNMLRGYFDKAVSFTSSLLSWVTHFTLQVSISLILSFMLLWDWPNIVTGVGSLERSRLQGIYKEVAPSLKVFAQLFGKALQAQTRIALANTALTAGGMWLLGIPGLLLLSLFVFLCSFIPVVGCVLSTIPIGFVALTEYGFMKLALVIAMVFIVHAVEAYGLNPAIYSAHLRLHPLLVLTVLVFAEHAMGVWGLLLAVPLTVFALDYCIRCPAVSLLTQSADFVDEEELQKYYATVT